MSAARVLGRCLIVIMSGCGGGAPGAPEDAADALVEVDDAEASGPETDAEVEPDAPDATAPPDEPGVRCGPGMMVGAGGVCMVVGPRDCAAPHLDADGVCRPSLDRCPSDQMPDLRAGCVPVGLSDCAPEFRNAETHVCEPRAELCPAGTLPLGVMACTAVEATPEDCGEPPFGPYPDDGFPTFFVDPAAPDGGDGSLGAPFKTIAAAQAAAHDSSRVVLAAGEYDEPVMFTEGQSSRHIWGRCTALVHIRSWGSARAAVDGDPAVQAGVVIQSAKGIEVRRLTVDYAELGIRVDDSRWTKLEDISFLRLKGSGVRVTGESTAYISRLRYVSPGNEDTMGGEFVAPLMVGLGGFADIEDSTFIGSTLAMAAATDASRIRARRVFVQNARVEHPDSPAISTSGVFDLEESAIIGATNAVSVGPSARVLVRNSYIADNVAVESDVNSTAAYGLKVDRGELLAEGNRIVRAGGAAVYVSGEPAKALLHGNLFQDTAPTDGRDGAGVVVRNKASAVSMGDVFVGNTHAALVLENEHAEVLSRVFVERGIVLDTQPDADGRWGLGAFVNEYSELTVLDSVFSGNHEFGVLGVLPSARVSLRHTLVATTLPAPAAGHGIGVGLLVGAIGVLDRVDLRENTVAGLLVSDPGAESSQLMQSRVASTRPGRVSTGDGAMASDAADGVIVLPDASLDVDGAVLEHLPRAALAFLGAYGSVRGTRVEDVGQGLVLQDAIEGAVDYSDPSNQVTPIVEPGALTLPTAASLLPP